MTEQLRDMGPIDFLVIEMPEGNVNGDGLLALVDLVDRGLIHIYDLAFVSKSADGVRVAPFASALRRNGAQLVAQGRIPINAVAAALAGDSIDENWA